MIPLIAAIALVASTAPSPAPASAQESLDARTIVQRSAAAMGGEALLRSIHSIEYVAVGERQMVEQSERPTGPYLLDHFQVHEIRDLAGGRAWENQQDSGYAGSRWWLEQRSPDDSTIIINGNVMVAVGVDGKQQYAGSTGISLERDQFAFAPERLLLTALAAPDLHRLADAVFHGVRHFVVGFTWNGAPCTIAIGQATMLPWQVTYTHAYDDYIFYSAWGDVTTQLTFTEWTLEPNGLHYPREWTYSRIGLPDQQLSIMQLYFNVPLDPKKLSVDPAILAAAPKEPRRISQAHFGGKALKVVTIAPHVVQVPSSWNVEFVDQPDGVVVIEAPIGPNYAKQAFAFARTYFHKPVKAAITTSDSFPHIAGVRQAVAEGIPIYALDLNVAILQRLIAAPHHDIPDDLAQSPRAPKFVPVTGRTTIGSGETQIELLPYRTVTAERQMMVYLPSPRLLYTSDLFAPDGNGGWFTPQYLDEFITACNRYGITPKTIFGMHYQPIPYTTVVTWLHNFEHASS
jgi:glyoxylase-like metal-dependent hydrolase (beta-lactamase superfamily II)